MEEERFMVKWRSKRKNVVVHNDNEVENKEVPGKLLTKKKLNLKYEKKKILNDGEEFDR